MPLYEYQCNNCNKIYELLIQIKEKDKVQYCPICENQLEKIISKNAFKLKEGGVGWAKDKYSKH